MMPNRGLPMPAMHRLMRGFSLIELLVGLVIGLISTIIIFQVFAVSEGYKRTTTGGGDAQTNGATALFTIERDLRQAGYGINSAALLGCEVHGWDEQAASGGASITLILAPVVITQGTDDAPDTVTVLYGDGAFMPEPAKLIQNMPSSSSAYKVDNRYGFFEGGLVIAAEPGKTCTLAQVSTLPGTPGNSSNVVHNSGTYTIGVGSGSAQVPTRYNRPSGLPSPYNVSYGTSAKLFNLGALPSSNTYSIQNAQLMLRSLFSDAPTVSNPIFDEIVQLQAQYGKDTNNDGIVDVFDETTPTTAAGWAQVLAARVALIARSGQYEKEQVTPATLAMWTDAGAPTWTLDDEERHYRYKTYSTIVPLRNMIWTPQ